jgi:NAD(P)-dependent dehydrogenase (short-subunit alcohol dehydrogenase family)
VHLGSIDGSLGNPSYAAYSVTKGSMIALTHVMAHDFAPFGIRVNLIARAAVEGTAALDWNEPPGSDLLAATPLGRPARPSEIADAVAFLASPASTYITGTVLTVDGGRTAITPGTARA